MSTFGQPTSVPALGSGPVDVPRTAPWVAAGVAAIVVVVAAGWFGVVAPQRTAAADLRDSTAQVEVNEQALAARVTDLKQQFAALPEHQAKLAALQEQLPGDAALPGLVRELRDVAARSGVQLTSLTPSAPVPLGGAATSTGQPAVSDAATGAAAASGSSDGASAGAATTTSTTGATGSTDAVGAALLQVPVTLTASGPYSGLMSFLAGVQQEQRLLLVTGTTVTTGTQTTGQSGLVLTVTGAVFALPSSTSDASTTTSAGAGSAGAATGTTAAAPTSTTTLN